MSDKFQPLQKEPENDIELITALELESAGFCYFCGEKMETKPCPDCAGEWIYSPDYCPTCQDTGTARICPNGPHL